MGYEKFASGSLPSGSRTRRETPMDAHNVAHCCGTCIMRPDDGDDDLYRDVEADRIDDVLRSYK